MSFVSLVLAVGVLSCSSKDDSATDDTGTYDPHVHDADGDGLVDFDEDNVYGTDKNNKDSDGDGWEDGDEILNQNTSPTNKYSHPYKGGFNVGACDKYPDPVTAHPTGSRIIETGGGGSAVVALYEEGDTVANFTLLDQYGEQVDLYSFCGKFVDIMFFQSNHLSTPEYGALECWIRDMRNYHDYYRDYGYELIVVLTQNAETELPTLDDLKAVAGVTSFDDSPVLASINEGTTGFHSWFEKDFHEPTLVHIGPDLKVLSVDKDDCAGFDRDPCPYMGDWVPTGLCWPEGPDEDCEPADHPPPYLFCACPAPACEKYCGVDNCPVTYGND